MRIAIIVCFLFITNIANAQLRVPVSLDSLNLEIFYSAEESFFNGAWEYDSLKEAIGYIDFTKDSIIVKYKIDRKWQELKLYKLDKNIVLLPSQYNQKQIPVVFPNKKIGICISSIGYLHEIKDNVYLPADQLAFEIVFLNISDSERIIFLGLINI